MVSGDEHEEEDEREEMWEEEEDILGTDDEAPEDTENDIVAAEADAAGSRCRFRGGRASNDDDDKGDVPVCGAACEVMRNPGEEAEMETEVEAGASHVPSGAVVLDEDADGDGDPPGLTGGGGEAAGDEDGDDGGEATRDGGFGGGGEAEGAGGVGGAGGADDIPQAACRFCGVMRGPHCA